MLLLFKGFILAGCSALFMASGISGYANSSEHGGPPIMPSIAPSFPINYHAKKLGFCKVMQAYVMQFYKAWGLIFVCVALHTFCVAALHDFAPANLC